MPTYGSKGPASLMAPATARLPPGHGGPIMHSGWRSAALSNTRFETKARSESPRAFVFVGVLDSVSVEAGRQKWIAPEIIKCGLQNQCGCVEGGITSGTKSSPLDSPAPATYRDHPALKPLPSRPRV